MSRFGQVVANAIDALKSAAAYLGKKIETIAGAAKNAADVFSRDVKTAVTECGKEVNELLHEQGGLTVKSSPDDYSGPMRKHNARLLADVEKWLPPDESPLANELKKFVEHYQANEDRYESVSVVTGLPPELIAAIHWREAGGDFACSMSNGSPLGIKSEIVPYDGPYDSWEESAIAVLSDDPRQDLLKVCEIDKDPNDLVALATFAESYNGRGYFNKGVASPYLFSGTDVYKKGKYVSDGSYDPDVVDKQIGVVPMLVALQGAPEGE